MWQSTCKLYRDWSWLVYLCLIQLWTTSCIISKTVYCKHCMQPGAQNCPTRLKIISKQGTNLICCQLLLWLSAVFIYAECNILKEFANVKIIANYKKKTVFRIVIIAIIDTKISTYLAHTPWQLRQFPLKIISMQCK